MPLSDRDPSGQDLPQKETLETGCTADVQSLITRHLYLVCRQVIYLSYSHASISVLAPEKDRHYVFQREIYPFPIRSCGIL